MKTYIALLRGINVGGKNTLTMKDLAWIFIDMGYSEVRTYIQSGNVIFRSATTCSRRTAVKIASRIDDNHGFEPKVLLLEGSELETAMTNNPYKAAGGKELHFYFLDSKPQKPDLQKLTKLKSASEEFKLHETVFYLLAPDGIGRSKLAPVVGRSLGVAVTARNLNTVNRLISMIEE